MRLKTPKYANIPGDILFDRRIPPAARDTYSQIRAVAWGKPETPAFSIDEMEALTGKTRSTLYEHMRLLRHVGALLWRPAGKSDIICSFQKIEGLGQSEKSDSLNSNKRIVITDLRDHRLTINSQSEKSDSRKPKPSRSRREYLK